MIRLHVAIVRTENPKPDPVVFLQGGPGANTLGFMGNLLFLFKDIRLDRDLIVFDQRGSGFSQPALDCPETAELSLELMDYELDGRRLGFMYRNLLSFRAVEMARNEALGDELPVFSESAKRVILASIPVGINQDRIVRYPAGRLRPHATPLQGTT